MCTTHTCSFLMCAELQTRILMQLHGMKEHSLDCNVALARHQTL